MKRIGVLTGGGDAPGLNPAIRAAVFAAADLGVQVIGIHDGWRGLLEDVRAYSCRLDPDHVRTWDRQGGTALGSSRTNPFRVTDGDGGPLDRSADILRGIDALALDGLIAIGGEDTLGVAARLAGLGVPVVGVPKTIDMDLPGTDYTLGFDTATRTVAELIERARTPAGSHHWVQVIEVMGRHAGHLALWSGLAGGASMILIPEHPFDIDRVGALLEERVSLARRGRDRSPPQYAVLVAAEGAHAAGAEPLADGRLDAFGHARLGGIGDWLAARIRELGRLDARSVALGHVQRGGPPSHVDRAMGWIYGVAAVEALAGGAHGHMVSARGVAPAVKVSLVPLSVALGPPVGVDVPALYDTDEYDVKRSVLGDHEVWPPVRQKRAGGAR